MITHADIRGNHDRHFLESRITGAQAFRAEYMLRQINSLFESHSAFDAMGRVAESIGVLVLIRERLDDPISQLALDPESTLRAMENFIKYSRKTLQC